MTWRCRKRATADHGRRSSSVTEAAGAAAYAAWAAARDDLRGLYSRADCTRAAVAAFAVHDVICVIDEATRGIAIKRTRDVARWAQEAAEDPKAEKLWQIKEMNKLIVEEKLLRALALRY